MVGIYDTAFYGCTLLAELNLPNTLEFISNKAFYGCSSLTELILPEGLELISDGAFYLCTSLRTVSLPNTLETLGDIFQGCDELDTFIVKSNHPTMAADGGVLYNHDRTELLYVACGVTGTVTIADTVTAIHDYAILGCDKVTCFVIPASLANIDNMAFAYARGLTSFIVAQANPSYTTWDGMLFERDMSTLVCCPGGRQGAVTLPDSVYYIEEFAFAYCRSLTSVTIPEGVEALTEYMFYKCESLTDLTLPASILRIDDGTFDDCPNLRITAPEGSYAYRWAQRNGKLAQ